MTLDLSHGSLRGLDEIRDIGRDRHRGGYSRHLWTTAELDLRAWFVERAERLGLDVETDRNGNLWAWWGAPGGDAVVTGSHLDSVPGGGEFDGPLGVVSALAAVARLQAAGVRPSRPFAILVFAEEEGSRFGIACLGSRLLTGALSGDRARALVDRDGTTLADAAARLDIDVTHLGRDDQALDRIGLFIELHVEQGRGLIDLDAPVAVASSILAHGRWRVRISGEGNHAGATRMSDRRDPMATAARVILEAQRAASATADSRATVGRLEPVPGGTNVIASRVDLWIDARSEDDAEALGLVDGISEVARDLGAADGCEVEVTRESWTGAVRFDLDLLARVDHALGGVPALPTGAGHDAGVLADHVPTAMLFVRNPTGVSHSPEEFAEVGDCGSGIDALETALRGLL